MEVTTGNLNTLFVSFNAAFRAGFGQAPTDHQQITMMVGSMTASEEYGFLGQWPGLKEWVGERVLRGISQYDYAIKNKTFESTIQVLKERIEDDNLGIFGPMFEEAGRASAAHPAELAYGLLKAGESTLCFDGQNFFDTDHPIGVNGEGGDQSNLQVPADRNDDETAWYLFDTNRALKPLIHQTRNPYTLTRMDDPTDENVFMRREFLYGVDGRCNVGFGLWQLALKSTLPLNGTNYGAARARMHTYKADAERPLGIMPNLLVIPPALEESALELINAERDANGATNVWRNTATVLMSPWLEAA